MLLTTLALVLCAAPVDADDDNSPVVEEGETIVEGAADAGYLYTADLTDAELERRFVEDLGSLGSISVGLAEAGRVINSVQMQPSPHVDVIVPENAWGAGEVIDFLNAVANDVAAALPDAPRLRINHIGKRDGGFLRPHFSHQSGRDVDVGFYYRPGVDIEHLSQNRIDAMNLAANWAMVKSLAARADVQVVLLDRKVQATLDHYAQGVGEDPALLERLFHSGAASMFQHARRHKDHFHVRFFAARAQELGRRIQPLLAKRADENKLVHRVAAGETLGAIASRFNSSVKSIQLANGLKNTLLSIGRTLVVPIRGPCTQCPSTAPVIIPPRMLAMTPAAAAAEPQVVGAEAVPPASTDAQPARVEPASAGAEATAAPATTAHAE